MEYKLSDLSGDVGNLFLLHCNGCGNADHRFFKPRELVELPSHCGREGCDPTANHCLGILKEAAVGGRSIIIFENAVPAKSLGESINAVVQGMS